MPPRNKIIISGYYGFGNAGDEAILAAVVTQFKTLAPGLPLVVLSAQPQQTAAAYGVEALNRTDWSGIYRLMRTAALFISGGGGLIQDSTGFATIVYYLGLVQLAKAAGCKTMLYAQGIGPVRTAAGKIVTRFAANRVNLITVRDEPSARLLLELGVTTAHMAVTADPVMNLNAAPEERVYDILTAEGIPARHPRLGISLRPWSGMDRILPEIIRGLNALLQTHQLIPVLFPFQGSQDMEVCRKVQQSLTVPSYVMTGTYTPAELMGAIGRMDVVLGMRLHSLIFAALQNIPALGLSYDPKVRQFLDSVGLPGVGLENLQAEKLEDKFSSLMTHSAKLKAEMLANVESLKTKARKTAELALELLSS